jgi:uncharacterized protein YkwD
MKIVFPDIQEVLYLHNKFRHEKKFRRPKKDLLQHNQLAVYASNWASSMAKNEILQHGNMQDILKLGFLKVAENIAYGQSDINLLMDGWMNSGFHQRNILDASMTHIGIGYAYSTKDVIFWCVCFGKPKP